MACYVTKQPPMTLFEAKEILGWEHGWDALHKDRFKVVDGHRLVRKTDAEILAEQLRIEKTREVGIGGPIIFCGDKLTIEQCACGALADLLCDYPMGKGKTCDMQLCHEHAFEVAEDRHLCLLHHAEFRGKAKVSRINPWPPNGHERKR